MYSAKFINPLIQLGHIEFTLVLSDPDGVLPDVRTDKSFAPNSTVEQLNSFANVVVQAAVAAFNNDARARHDSDPFLYPEHIDIVHDTVVAEIDLPEGVELE